MNLQHKRILANKVRLLTAREENENERIIAAVFNEFANNIDNSLNKGLDFDIDYDFFSKKLKTALTNCFNKSSKRAAEWCKTLFGWKLENSDIEAIHNTSLNEYNKRYSAKKVKGITESTKDAINRIIEREQAKGLNYKKISDIIVNEVKGMSKGRATTISRTETSNSINSTTNTAAVEAGMTFKTWLHVGGGKEDRESHLALDGKTIKLREYFNVGGSLALYPHDPNLPPGQLINCHCIVIYS